jgi:hypothetical protein
MDVRHGNDTYFHITARFHTTRVHIQSNEKYETIIECAQLAIDANVMLTTSRSEKLPSSSQSIVESFSSIRSRPSFPADIPKTPLVRINNSRRWTQDQ